MKINLVMATEIITLSEIKSRHERLKRLVSNWKNVALVSIATLTLKVIAEQLWMAIR